LRKHHNLLKEITEGITDKPLEEDLYDHVIALSDEFENEAGLKKVLDGLTKTNVRKAQIEINELKTD